eukprot:15372802-Alexandrium_andersonii.AAC.1
MKYPAHLPLAPLVWLLCSSLTEASALRAAWRPRPCTAPSAPRVATRGLPRHALDTGVGRGSPALRA